MKRIATIGIFFLAGVAGEATAACDGTPITNRGRLETLLNRNTVCGKPGANYTGDPNDRWQEEHIAGGTLKDYKRGPTDKIDPSEVVGNWGIARVGTDNLVTYTYTGGSSFSYIIYDHGSGPFRYSFCDGSNEIVIANIQSGAACPPMP